MLKKKSLRKRKKKQSKGPNSASKIPALPKQNPKKTIMCSNKTKAKKEARKTRTKIK